MSYTYALPSIWSELKMQPFTKKYQCTGTANQIIVVSVSLN